MSPKSLRYLLQLFLREERNAWLQSFTLQNNPDLLHSKFPSPFLSSKVTAMKMQDASYWHVTQCLGNLDSIPGPSLGLMDNLAQVISLLCASMLFIDKIGLTVYHLYLLPIKIICFRTLKRNVISSWARNRLVRSEHWLICGFFCCLRYSVCLEDPAQITASCPKQADSISA